MWPIRRPLRCSPILGLLAVCAVASAEIRYELEPMPAAGVIRVAISPDDPGETAEFRIPAWCPGFYFLQRYQDKISDARAVSETGRSLTVVRTQDSRGWIVSNPDQAEFTFSYRVLGNDGGLGFFGVATRSEGAFVNGPAAFMYVKGRKDERSTLRLVLPPRWDVATGMSRSEDGLFEAADYDELIDHPLELGAFQRHTKDVGGIPFEAVFVSRGLPRANTAKLAEELWKVSAPAIKMFGGAPFRSYTYIVHLAVGDFSGGLEHRSSTVLAMPDSSGLRLAELAAHELFHAWNVKQLRPKELGPFDYDREVRSPHLWFAEGVTDYYAHLMVYRSGDRDANWLLDALGDKIAELQASRNRLRYTLEAACLQAWENGGFGIGDLSYYTKGLVAGLLFDAAIRSHSRSGKSLDDVLRALYAKHRLPNPGFEGSALVEAFNSAAEHDLGELYRRIVQSTEELPYKELSAMGLVVVAPGSRAPTLGFVLEADGRVSVTEPGIAGELRTGDRLLRVNGVPLAGGAIPRIAEGEAFTVQVDRSGRELAFTLKVGVDIAERWRLLRDPFAEPGAVRLREKWLAR